jgi:hypothetical protein
MSKNTVTERPYGRHRHPLDFMNPDFSADERRTGARRIAR